MMDTRRFPIVLTVVVLAAHLYTMVVFGATYWIDSFDYASFGEFIRDGALPQFYTGDRYFLLQHLMPGLPLVWSILSQLPADLIWWTVALLQHGLAAAALIIFALALRPYLSPWAIIVGAVATSLLPFFSAFHNALMTESVTSSAVLFASAQALACCTDRGVTFKRAALIAGSVVVASMFRNYFVLLGVSLAAVAFLISRRPTDRLRAVAAGAVVAFSVLAFPIYRYTVLGEFFLPNLDFIEPTLKSIALPGLTPSAEAALRELPELPSIVSIDQLRTRPVSYTESVELSRRMLAEGQSKETVRSTLRRVGDEMMRGQFLHSLRFTLTAIGMLVVPYLGDPAAPGQSYQSVGQAMEHQQYYYQWFGWTQRDNYWATFDSFVTSSRQSPDLYSAVAVDRVALAVRPHLADAPLWAKDPLRLAAIPPDIFIAGWALFVVFMLFRAPAIAAIFALPVAMVLIACMTVPINSIRYSHPLFPFYLFGTASIIIWGAAGARTMLTSLRDRSRRTKDERPR